jgi:hypothetical protein
LYLNIKKINNIFSSPDNKDFQFKMNTQYMPCHDDLARIKCALTADMARAVVDLGLWKTIRDFTGESFMFDGPPELNKLDDHPLVNKYGHSGASFGCCLRNVQFIGKNGVDAFNTLYDSQQ